jgi:acylphosphatase
MAPDIVAHRVVVRGHVQGVFFRDTTRRMAERLGVKGWVTNRHDGAVEAWLEGDPDSVERIERWMREGGPRGARVTTIEAVAEQPEGAPGFTIRD